MTDVPDADTADGVIRVDDEVYSKELSPADFPTFLRFHVNVEEQDDDGSANERGFFRGQLSGLSCPESKELSFWVWGLGDDTNQRGDFLTFGVELAYRIEVRPILRTT